MLASGIFLAVNDTLLEGDVELAEGNLFCACTERLEDVDCHWIGRRAHFQALDLFGR